MTRKITWLLLSCLMVLALVLASCGPAVEEEEEVVTEEEKEKEVVTEEEEEEVAVEEGLVMVRDSLGILKEKPRYGGLGRYCWTGTGGIRNWDPAAITAGTWHLGMYQALTRADFSRGPSGTNEFGFTSGFFLEKYRVGSLAESWETPDTQTVIIYLREGVHFHDKPPTNGREMVADDVVFCFQRSQEHPQSFWYRKPGTPEEEYFIATAIDKYTVEVKLPEPDTRPWADISLLIYPPEAIEEYGSLEDWRNNCGTGPWVCTDFVPDSSLTYVKNENYWDVDPFFPENKIPYMDGWTDINVPEYTTALAALRTGKVDWWTGINWEDAELLMQSNPELKYRAAYQFYAPVIQMRNDLEPFSDILFRKALTIAIDRQGIARDLFKGNALVHHWFFRPDMGDIHTPLEELPEDVHELYQYSPEKAKQLLAEAGYPTGYKVELLVSSDREHVDLAQIIKMYWDAIGIETNVNVLEGGTFYSRMFGWRYDQTALVHWNNTNPFYMTDVAYHTDRMYNYSKVSDTRIDETSILLQQEPDPEERARIFKEVEPYVLSQCWNIALPLAYHYVFWQPWIKGYSGEWYGGFSYRWLDLDLRKDMIGY